MLGRASLLLAALLLTAPTLAVSASAAWAESPGAVLPPEQETAVQAMLGAGGPVSDCQLQDARIERDVIQANYQCAAAENPPLTVKTTWRHAAKAQPGDAMGGSWALSLQPAHPGLRDALITRAVAEGAKVLWQVPATELANAPTPLQGEAAAMRRPLSAEAQKAYDATHRLIEEGKADACIELLLPVVRADPHPLLMGRLVVASAGLASMGDGIARVDLLVAAADAHPDDSLAQFLGGVAVHYRGHLRAGSVEEKRRDYTTALRLLQRVAKEYADSPRLWIYTAVSHLRLGHQADAEQAIELAVRHDDGSDADVYYCRAEVWHRKDPAKALQDIARYQQIMVVNKEKGAFLNAKKEKRVEDMRQVIAKAHAEKHPLTGEDLFDPILGAPPLQDKPMWPKVIAGTAALVLAARLWLRRRKSSAAR